MLCQLFDTVNDKYQKSKKNCNWFKLFEMSWLYSQHFTFHWKLLGLVSRIEKSGTGDNNFGKWKGTFRSDRPKWPDRSQWTTFKAGPEYSGRTKPKWSVPFDEPTEISGILGWMESARKHALINYSWIIQKCWERSRKFTQRIKAALIRNTQQRQNVCVQHFVTLNSS